MKRGDIVKIQSSTYGLVDGYVSQVNTQAVPGVVVPYVSVVYPYNVKGQSVDYYEPWHEHYFHPDTGSRFVSTASGTVFPSTFPVSSRLKVEAGIQGHIAEGDTLQ